MLMLAELFKGFSIGATASMIFGTIKQKRDVVFSQSDIFNRRDEYTYTTKDYTYDFGVQYLTNIGGKNLIFGATYCPESNLSARNSGVIYTYDVSSDFEYIRDTIEVFSRCIKRSCSPSIIRDRFGARRTRSMVCVRRSRL